MSDFVHLHVHTQYSLLDGACALEKLVKKAKSMGMDSLAITDHGNMFGAIEFYELCKKNDIKPIIGVEAYEARSSRFDKGPFQNQEEDNYHILLLAQDEQGYKNLLKLVSLSYLEGFYYRPRIDRELLKRYSQGLICLTSCLKGRIPRLVLKERIDEAYKECDDLFHIFGRDRFYLELMDNFLPEQKKVNRVLIKMSKDLDIPLVATNDVHYLEKDDAFAHEILLCIQTQTNINDPKRMRLQTQEFYLKSPLKMQELFKDIPQALKNTVKISQMCNLELKFGQLHLPSFPLPEGKDPYTYLEELCLRGLKEKYPQGFNSGIKERLHQELEVIRKMGYEGYFLVVQDIVNFAKNHGIPVGPGRGSAAGSLVSYLLNITEIDPLKYGLFFERFLNPQRVSMPDIDIDFCYEKRPQVIEYVAQKYGRENVAQIITFGTMQARAVVRDVGRALGFSYQEVDRIAKLIPFQEENLKSAIEDINELKRLYQENERIRQLLDIAQKLEGLSRHASIHAAGIVIADKPLTEYVPLYKTSDGEVTTGFSMKPLEKLGLLKMDFLGLKTLTLIDTTLKIVKRTKNVNLDIQNLNLDDKKTYHILCSGQTLGVFQLESSGMRDLLRKLRPQAFEDLIACLALYRPGPIGARMLDDFIERKHGRQPVHYLHPLLKNILNSTYGIIVYQEQVMQIASQMAGFTMAEADLLRRAMGKKIPEEMEKVRQKFIEGCKSRGIKEDLAMNIFSLMEHFAGYGFNKSHSTAYALISYRTAYLKAHFPVEFMAALLSSEKDNQDKIMDYVNEARRLGIKILPPDINESFSDFTVTSSGEIRFGLMAVKNVGRAAVESIINARKTSGKFVSFQDFCMRVDSRTVNKKVIESLIKCGAFDSLGFKRAQLMSILEKTLDMCSRAQKNKSRGQLSLFDNDSSFQKVEIPEIEEWPTLQLLNFEKQLLGFFVTGHPLNRYQKVLNKISVLNISRLAQLSDNQEVVISGVLQVLKTTITRKNQPMAILRLEDTESQVEVFAFPEVYQKYFKNITSGNLVIIKGRVNFKEATPKVIASSILSLEETLDSISVLQITLPDSDPKLLTDLRAALSQFPGNTPVFLNFKQPELRLIKIKVKDQKVRPQEELFSMLEELVGEGNFSLKL